MVVGARATSPIGGSFHTCSPRAREEVLHTYALRHVSLDELAADYPGRSLSRSFSPTTMWFLDGTHCMMCLDNSVGIQVRGNANFLEGFFGNCFRIHGATSYRIVTSYAYFVYARTDFRGSTHRLLVIFFYVPLKFDMCKCIDIRW